MRLVFKTRLVRPVRHSGRRRLPGGAPPTAPEAADDSFGRNPGDGGNAAFVPHGPCCGGRGSRTSVVTGVLGVRPASPAAGRSHHHWALCLLTGEQPAGSATTGYMDHGHAEHGTIKVFLADDNLIVREGVR